MGGYTKQFSSVAGDKIDAELFDTEYQLVEDGFVSHKHDGVTPEDGMLIPLISDSDFLNSIEVNSIDNQIEINTEVGGVKTLLLTLIDGVLVPAQDNYLDLGTNTNKIKDIHVGGNINTIELTLNNTTIVSILDEDDMNSDAVNSLVTQQSVKAFVEGSISVKPGLFLQSQALTREDDLALGGGMGEYLVLDITVQKNSVIHIHSFIGAEGAVASGTVFATIYRRDPLNAETLLTPEEFVVVQRENDIVFSGSTGHVITDNPYDTINPEDPDTKDYTYIIKMRHQNTTGTATHASMLLLEEKGV